MFWVLYMYILSIHQNVYIYIHVWFPFVIISHILVSTGESWHIFQLQTPLPLRCPGVLCSCRCGGATYGPSGAVFGNRVKLESADLKFAEDLRFLTTPYAPRAPSAYGFGLWVKRVPKHRASQGMTGALGYNLHFASQKQNQQSFVTAKSLRCFDLQLLTNSPHLPAMGKKRWPWIDGHHSRISSLSTWQISFGPLHELGVEGCADVDGKPCGVENPVTNLGGKKWLI